jgi:hypothetical protein
MSKAGKAKAEKASKERAERLWIVDESISRSASLLHAEDLRDSVETAIRILEGDCDVPRLRNCWRAGVFRGVLVTVAIMYAGELYGRNDFLAGTNKRKTTYPDFRERLIKQFGKEERYQKEFPSWCTEGMIRSHRANLLRLASLPRATQGKDDWYEVRFGKQFEDLTNSQLAEILPEWPAHASEGVIRSF